MKKVKKGFTLIEIVIVIMIIGVISAILIPTFVSVYDYSKENIVDIYNNDNYIICYYNEDEIIYEGPSSQVPAEFKAKYNLVNIKYENNIIYLYYIDKLESSAVPLD